MAPCMRWRQTTTKPSAETPHHQQNSEYQCATANAQTRIDKCIHTKHTVQHTRKNANKNTYGGGRGGNAVVKHLSNGIHNTHARYNKPTNPARAFNPLPPCVATHSKIMIVWRESPVGHCFGEYTTSVPFRKRLV